MVWNALKTLGAIWLVVLLLALSAVEMLFYLSPFLILAAVWIVVYYELFSATRKRSKKPCHPFYNSELCLRIGQYAMSDGKRELGGRFKALVNYLEEAPNLRADFSRHLVHLRPAEVLEIARQLRSLSDSLYGTTEEVKRKRILLNHVAAYLVTGFSELDALRHPLRVLTECVYALAGMLVKYCLPIPSLKHLAHPLQSSYFLPFLLTFLEYLLYSRRALFGPFPCKVTLDEHAETLYRSLTLAIFSLAHFTLSLPLDFVERSTVFVLDALEPQPHSRQLEERAFEAILVEILEWKARKNEREERRVRLSS
ncbi:hypothetical protein JCM8547_002906 [Rhodosporidiobolus lusitaniae]